MMQGMGRVLMLLCIVSGTLSHAHAEDIKIAVASNFTFAMKALVNQFETETEHRVIVSYGSSGKIFAQIQHGAPFQAFFSADQAKPVALEKSGYAVSGSRFTYATGALALWSRSENLVDQHLTVLHNGNFNKLALANPKLAPYGLAAMEVLQHLGLVDSTRSKWVKGENISQTYQFVATGNAEVGFIALSQLRAKNNNLKGSYYIVPSELYSAIHQDAVLLQNGKDSKAVADFLSFIKSNQANKIIQSYGYTTMTNQTDAPVAHTPVTPVTPVDTHR
ncbi:MAG: molybdate ABC transporter substrate-binding protein [Pseudomonadales bacterium]|nr:molybdate ABC transporter substrate-binding protein [Pseudomonadales bacterium]